MSGEPVSRSASEADPGRTPQGPFAVAAAVIGIVVCVLAVYAQVGGHAFLLLDDDVYVTNNPQVLRGLGLDGVRWAFEAPRSANYHPLTYLSHMLDVELYGVERAGPHLGTNVALHALGSVLLFFALRSLAGGFWPPLLATLFFALHPLRVESVAWLAERKDVLSGVFFFASLWVYAAWARRGGVGRYAVLLLLFGLGLLSKSTLVTLPFVLLLLDVWPLRRLRLGGAGPEAPAGGSGPGRLVWEKLPLFAMAVALGVATALAQGEVDTIRSELPGLGRVCNALASYGGYLLATLLPIDLAIFYPHPVILDQGISGALVLRAGLSLAVLVAISALCWRERLRAPWLGVGWLWFLGMLVPVIGVVQVGIQGSADRYTYLPSVGLAIGVVWSGAALLAARPALRPVVGAATALVLVLLAGAAWRYAGRFESNLTLFQHAAVATERNYFAHNQVGMSYQAAGDLVAAREAFERSLAIVPSYDWAHHNLAINYYYEQRYPDAERHFRLTLMANPGHVEARSNLAVLFQAFGRYEESAALLQEALGLQPDRAELHYNLGTVYFALRRWAEAEAELQTALSIHPAMTGAWKLLGFAALEQGQSRRAEEYLRQAVVYHPDDAEAIDALASLLEQRGAASEAAQLRAQRPAGS